MSFKRAHVVMLPANQKAPIGTNVIVKHNETLSYGKKVQEPYNMVEDEQHLYFLCDEDIKEGDWCIMLDSFNNIFSTPQQFVDSKTQFINKGNLKIIATTDKSLGSDYNGIFGGLGKIPQPSEGFIRKFVDSYNLKPQNKNKPIEEVLVEYELSDYDLYSDRWKLKVNSKDNTITIKKVKDVFTREEVINLFKLREKTIHNYNTEEDWIKEYL